MKYAVFTYLFGKNKEIFRDPEIIDEDTEYICVTDQPDLKSNVWKIINVSLNEIKSLRDKTALTKFDPFLYTKADRIVIQDMTLKSICSLKELFAGLDDNDICLKKHPARKCLAEELPHWKARGVSVSQIAKFFKMAEHNKIELTEVPLFECCVMCVKNDANTQEIFSNLLALMKLLGENGKMIATQQCPFAYLLKVFYPDLKIGFIDQHKFFIRYIHNSNVENKT